MALFLLGHRLETAFDVRTWSVQLSDMSQALLFSLKVTTAVMAAERQLAPVRLEMGLEREFAAVAPAAIRAAVLGRGRGPRGR